MLSLDGWIVIGNEATLSLDGGGNGFQIECWAFKYIKNLRVKFRLFLRWKNSNNMSVRIVFYYFHENCFFTAQRILERLGIQIHHCLSKSDWSIFLILKPISSFLVLAWFLCRNYWSSLDHDLMASIWEKAISILAGNLNSGGSYVITAVDVAFIVQPRTLKAFSVLPYSFTKFQIFPKT